MFDLRPLTACAIAAAAIAAAPATAATYPAWAGIPEFGGIVFDAKGLNGERLLSHTAASELNKGVARGDPETNDFFIGEQGGFSTGILDQLGGGFASLSIRVTLFDGDNDPGNFDDNDNFLRVNGVVLGNFSDVVTTTTDAAGNILNGVDDGIGFGDEETDTGTFKVMDRAALSALFASLERTNTLSFELDKRDTNGNFFDFHSASRIPQAAVTLVPTVAQVPLPAGGVLLLAGLGGLGLLRHRKAI
jgi:hypothetical protein